MLSLEVVFFGIFALAIVRLAVGQVHPALKYSILAYSGLASIALAALLFGWRWQMYPATLGFILLVMASLKKRDSTAIWRTAGAVSLTLLLATSIFLSQQIPVIAMPAPSGPYAVGNLDYSTIDSLRTERWAPQRKRELYVEVWYPAQADGIDSYPVRTLHQELYEGDYDIWSFLLGYLKNIPTSSHRGAPLADSAGEEFPVLLFNHGADGYTSQNQILMEHLASNGYVILSIAHPYQSLKVNLPDAGKVTLTSERPQDTGFDVEQMERSLGSAIRNEYNTGFAEYSAMRALQLELVDKYADAQTPDAKRMVVTDALELAELQPYLDLMTEDSLAEYLRYVHGYQHRQIEYWVEDVQFIADTLSTVDTGIEGLNKILDTDEFGVVGMSFGGAAAGEFCKIDRRCKAGVNLDGTQFGRHWNQPLEVPFMMLYNEIHQGGNDYAYMPAGPDYREFTISEASHVDFLDLTYTHPIIRTLGLGGGIDGRRMMDIINVLNLDFFDEFLKGKRRNDDTYQDLPELLLRAATLEMAYMTDRNYDKDKH